MKCMIQMQKLFLLAALIAIASLTTKVFAGDDASQTADEPTKAPAAKVKYKSSGAVNFEELLIQGELKRPEVSIITGNVQQGTDGLLRLRENFTDRITMDAGEEL